MTRFSVYASPLPLPDGGLAEYGEATWVVADEPGIGWPCLTDAAATCAASLWSTDGYRPATGRCVTTAEGALDVATCLAGAAVETFEGLPSAAGIVYGVNGVGHQIANRILFDTSVDVRNAEGAWFSWWLFGTYGTSIPGGALLGPVFGPVGKVLDRAIGAGLWLDWERRKKRCHTTRTMMDDARAMRRQAEDAIAAIERRTDTAFACLSTRAGEIAAMLTKRSGGGLSERVLGDVRELVQATAGHLRDADHGRDVRADAHAVAAECNASFTQHFSEVAGLLGSDAYVQIFGVHPDAPVTLVDAGVLARHA